MDTIDGSNGSGKNVRRVDISDPTATLAYLVGMGESGSNRKDQEAFVYFVRSGDLIKIGKADDVEKRFRGIVGMCAEPAELLGYYRADRKEESRLHARFKAIRAHHEWFRATPELLTYIHENRSLEPAPSKPKYEPEARENVEFYDSTGDDFGPRGSSRILPADQVSTVLQTLGVIWYTLSQVYGADPLCNPTCVARQGLMLAIHYLGSGFIPREGSKLDLELLDLIKERRRDLGIPPSSAPEVD